MESSLLSGADDIQAMQELIGRLASSSTVVDFDEQIHVATVRAVTRLWRDGAQLIAFAYVDDFNNLWFDTTPEFASSDELASGIIEWGSLCVRGRNAERGTQDALDSCCQADDSPRLRLLERYGFVPQPVRTLKYSRAAAAPVPEYPLPAGFSIRSAHGKDEVQQLVALHRAAFQTSSMTVEHRLAMMSTPRYIPDLDLVAVTPNGELAAFCVCGFADLGRHIGYTEPIGTHPSYQRMGLGSALVSNGLRRLKGLGVQAVELGTSSDNLAMQALARKLGFVVISEKVWLSRTVT